jgi:hypothetical protein
MVVSCSAFGCQERQKRAAIFRFTSAELTIHRKKIVQILSLQVSQQLGPKKKIDNLY